MPSLRMCREALLFTPPHGEPLLLLDREGVVEASTISGEDAVALARLAARELPAEAARDRAEAWERRWPGLLRHDTLEEELAALDTLNAKREELREYLTLVEGPAADTADYHLEVISDATEQFEEVETTLSHFFHIPHPALQGRRYGAALCDALLAMSPLAPGAGILEIGCGTGLLARCLLDRLREVAPELYATCSYTMLDLSPALQQAQRAQLAEHMGVVAFVHADALSYQAAQPYDLVISNEVIADLVVHRLDPFTRGATAPEAQALWERYDLRRPGAPSRMLLNTGAMKLVARLPTLLARGGLAALSEYGGRDAPAVARPLGEHVEYSIHFGHLETVARAEGLEPQLQTTTELLGMDREVEIIDVVSLDLIRKEIVPRLGRAPLPRVAFTRELLRAELGDLVEQLHNVSFHPVGTYPYDLIPDRYLYLTLRRD